MKLLDRWVRLAAAGLTLSLLSNFSIPAQAASAPTVSEWTVLQRMSPGFIANLSHNMRANPDGSESMNHYGWLQVGMQRSSMYGVPAAVLAQNASALDKSFAAIEYAFAHQHPDGSFDYSEGSSGMHATPTAEALSVAFFLGDLGHTILLLQSSPWFMTSPQTASQRAQLARIKSQAVPTLNWYMSRQSVVARDTGTTNRIIAYGLAYYLMGRALDRPDAMAVGRSFMNRALAGQMSDGTFPEGGGFDSSYQNVSLYQLMVYYLNLGPDDTYMRSQLWTAIANGMNRELKNVGTNGQISTEGNSRVGGNSTETYFGHAKTVDAPDASLSFEYYANITNDPGLRTLADNVEQTYLK